MHSQKSLNITPGPLSASPRGKAHVPGFIAWIVVVTVLGWLAWYLKGNDLWTWLSALFGGMLAVGIWDRTKAWMDGAQISRREVVITGYCVATWLVWFLPGVLFPATPVRYEHDPLMKVSGARLFYDGELLTTIEEGKEFSFRCRQFDEKKLRLEVLSADRWIERGLIFSKDPRHNALLFRTHDVLVKPVG